MKDKPSILKSEDPPFIPTSIARELTDCSNEEN